MSGSDNGAVGDLPSLIDRIEALVEQPTEGPSEVLLEAMEHTLTDGYAQALAIEGERLRIEREIAAQLAAAAREDGTAHLVALAERLAEQERALKDLRELLDELRVRRESVRRETD
jgi:hypothetical protein